VATHPYLAVILGAKGVSECLNVLADALLDSEAEDIRMRQIDTAQRRIMAEPTVGNARRLLDSLLDVVWGRDDCLLTNQSAMSHCASSKD
jgi:hypothetical protein